MTQYYQQTVRAGIDTESGQELWASDLLEIGDSEFAALRRTAMRERSSRRKGEESSARFICAYCKGPLWLTRYHRENGNRWFKHDKVSTTCIWSEGPSPPPDLFKAIQYRGQQEGKDHRNLKQFIAQWLANEPGLQFVSQEKVTLGEILKGEWKRPDVSCQIEGRKLVFELQLSYEFLSHIIKRDDFYRVEKTFIIWVFREFDLNRAAIADEAFFNRRNLFVLDASAMEKTITSGRLHFNVYHQCPLVIDGQIFAEWTHTLASLDALKYPEGNYRPYFIDYEKEKERVWNEYVKAEPERQKLELSRMVTSYLLTAISYYESDYQEPFKKALLVCADDLFSSPLWDFSYKPLESEEFFGWHRVLPILLSISLNRPVGYNVRTVFQVLEAGLRQTTPWQPGNCGFAVVYLWAYDIFRPHVSDAQRQWIRKRAREIKQSIEAGEPKYLRVTEYDESISLLFPKLEEKLCSTWGIAMTADQDGDGSYTNV